MDARRTLAAITFAVTLGTIGCASAVTRPEPEAQPLIVRNSSVYDVNVFIVRDAGGPAVRVGTVIAHTTGRLAVRSSQLPLDNTLTVAVHPVGTSENWTSPSITLADGMFPVLEVLAGPGGDCSRSTFTLLTAAGASRVVRRP